MTEFTLIRWSKITIGYLLCYYHVLCLDWTALHRVKDHVFNLKYRLTTTEKLPKQYKTIALTTKTVKLSEVNKYL